MSLQGKHTFIYWQLMQTIAEKKGMELFCYSFVAHPEEWKYTNARNFQEDHTILQIETIVFLAR